MFKIPDWENDVPISTNTFGNKTKKKKETPPDKLLSKSDHVNKKIEEKIIFNEISKRTSKKVKHVKKNTKQIRILSQGDKIFNSKNITGNGFKNNMNNNISKDANVNDIMETSRRVKTKKYKTDKHNHVNTMNVTKAKLKKKETNATVPNVQEEESEITAKEHSSEGRITPNLAVNGMNNGQNANKILDNETCLIQSNMESDIQNNLHNISEEHKNDEITEPDADSSLEDQNLDSDLLDEALINAKKRKLNKAFENDDQEDLLFGESIKKVINNNPIEIKKEKPVSKNEVIPSACNPKVINGHTKIDKKKEIIKKLLLKQNNRNSINISGNKLRSRMLERLKAAQFRYLNEKLYTTSGSDAQKLFQSDPESFQTYHEGYRQQLKKWPVNPLDVIVKKIQKIPKSHKIADLGCGEAELSKRVPHNVRSFDLIATAPGVEACDMAHTPLLAASIDVAVYCLALMGTDLTRYLMEANRILKIGGHLLIAEVESRFEKVEDFAKEVERLGFKLKKLDKTNKVFFFMEFTKIREPPVKKSKLPMLTLKPCFYKKR